MEIIVKKEIESIEKYIMQNLGAYGLCFEVGGLDIRVSIVDECPLYVSDCNPQFLNLLKHYEFGTRELESKEGEGVWVSDICESLEEVEKWLEDNGYFYQRIDGYEHGGLSLSLAGEGFYCSWDSGVAGYLVMKKSELREARGVKRLSKKMLEQEISFYRSLINELNYWLDGSIYELSINGDYIEGYMYSVSELAEHIEAALAEAEMPAVAEIA